jgi:hypothetical protein
MWRETANNSRRAGGRDVAKILWVGQLLVLHSAVLGFQAFGQATTGPMTSGQASMSQLAENNLVEPRPTLTEGTAACSQPQRLTIPRAAMKRAKMKAQLLNELRESIFDDAKGIVNLAREKQIKDLAGKLTKDKDSY